MDQDFIPYEDYACLCHDKNVTNSQSKEQLIDLLHNLGLVLNFRNHPILKDTNVLAPEWVTEGIYALLSDDTLKTESKGILTNADLNRVLDSERYPPKRHPYLTELIREFQLGFPLTDNNSNNQEKRFLLPSILPKEEPEDITLEGDKTGNTLEFQYHYRILPEGIISRFIVLTHADIHNQTYWRTGVMLHYTEGSEIYNVARIKADLEDRKIFITISGKEATRRVFLALLRKTFSRIHNSFANLEVSGYVPVPGYPKHPPLQYEEMLGLEEMNVQEYPIGKLSIKVNVRQLLNGYESLETRQQRRYEEQLGKAGMREGFMPERAAAFNFYGETCINQLSQNQGERPMNKIINQQGQGDNYAGDNVHGDKIRHPNQQQPKPCRSHPRSQSTLRRV